MTDIQQVDKSLESLALWLQQHVVSYMRQDVKSRYFPPYLDSAGVKQKGGYAKSLTPVTLLDIQDHLSGKQPLGCYVVDPVRDGTVRAAVVDLDDKERELTFEQLCRQALMISNELEEHGLSPWACSSGSGHGVHLWLFWRDPQNAGAVRKLLKAAREKSGVTCHVDIFPAQDRVGTQLGNLVALPLGRASRPLDLAAGAVWEDLGTWARVSPAHSARVAGGDVGVGDDLEADAGRGLQLVGQGDQQLGPVDPAYLASALKHVGSGDYLTWVRVTLAVKLAIEQGRLAEEAAFRLWDEWCSSAPNYDQAANAKGWERGFKPHEGGVTLGTVFHLAGVGGWKPPAGQVIYLPGFEPTAPPAPTIADNQTLSTASIDDQVQERTVLAETHAAPVSMKTAQRVKTKDPERYAQLLRWQDRSGPPEIQEINEDHFLAYDGGKLFVFKEKWDTALKRYCVERRSVRDFRDANKDQIVVGVRRGVNILKAKGDMWLESPHRRRYEEVVFEPKGCEPWKYNLWQGWAYEPSPEGSWGLLKNHVFNNICRQDSVAYEYLLNWLALTCQKPDEHIGVAVVFQGDKGTGKSFFVRMFGKLFGQNFMQVSSTKAVTGHFNAHLRDCVLLFADEISYTGRGADTAALNALITEDTLTVEGKGQNAVSVRNMLHLVIATNHAEAVPASKDERRFFCLHVGNDQQQVQRYFDAIETQLRAGGFGRMLWDMLERDVSKFNVRRIPQTDELAQQKINNLTTAGQWWLYRLQEGTSHEETDTWETAPVARELYEDYLRFCKEGGLLFRRDDPIVTSVRSLSTAIWRLLNGDENGCLSSKVEFGPVRLRDGTTVRMNRRVWSLPDIEACRRKFGETLRIENFKWDAPVRRAVDATDAVVHARNDDGTLDFGE